MRDSKTELGETGKLLHLCDPLPPGEITELPPWSFFLSVREARMAVIWRISMEWATNPDKYFPSSWDYSIMIDGGRNLEGNEIQTGLPPFLIRCSNGKFEAEGAQEESQNCHAEADQAVLFHCHQLKNSFRSFLV